MCDTTVAPIYSSKWPEIQERLHDGQAAHCRHDIIARVFHLVKKIMQLLNKGCFWAN